MIPNKINLPCQLRFTVLDVDNSGVTGITLSQFLVRIYNPADAEVSGSVGLVRKELGNGDYEITFTPNALGKWYVVVTHSVYFPWGKAAAVMVSSESLTGIDTEIAMLNAQNVAIQNSVNAMGVDVQFIKDIEGGRWWIDRTINQMIFYKEDNVTEVARFDLKDFDGLPASENVYQRTRVTSTTTTTTTTV